MIKRLTVWFLGIVLLLNGNLAARAQDNPVITPENAALITQLAIWGRGTIRDLDWSPDGTMLAVSGSLGVWIYDAQHWQAEPRPVAQGESGVSASAFSADARTLATLGAQGNITLWDVNTGEEIHTLEKQVSSLAFSPDGVTLALALGDGVIQLWDTATWHPLATFEGHGEDMLSVAFSPDSAKLAAGDNDGLIWVWDVQGEQLYATLEGHTNQVWSVAFSPDGQEIASWSTDSSVRFWSVESGQPSAVFDLYERVAYSPAGARVAMGYPGGTIRLQENGIERELVVFQESRTSVTALAFNPAGTQLAVCNGNEVLKIWDIEQDEAVTLLSGYIPRLQAVTFSPDGRILALGGSERSIRLWNPITGAARVLTWGHAPGWIELSLNNTFLAVVDTFDIRVWRLADDTLLCELSIDQARFYAAAWSPDGTRLAGAGGTWNDGNVPGSPSDQGFVQFWDTATWRRIDNLSLPGDAASIAFSPDGSLLAYGNEWGDVYLVDVETMQVVQEWHTGGAPSVVSFSPDGERLGTTGLRDCTAQVYTLREETPAFALRSCGPLVWSPQGDLLAAVEGGGKVSLWDAATGEKLFSSTDYSRADGLAFSPDGSLLVTAGQDGTVRLWGVVGLR